jgi:hypothetical protein
MKGKCGPGLGRVRKREIQIALAGSLATVERRCKK